MTQTEKLGNRIDYLVSSAFCTSADYPRGMTWGQLRCALLEACKESGLKFTKTGVVGDDLEGAYLCKVEEIEL